MKTTEKYFFIGEREMDRMFSTTIKRGIFI